MLKSNLNPAEHDDMLLTPYLQVETMPAILRDTLRVARTDEERDMLLMSALTACSAVLPNVYFRYGHLKKRYYPNLQTFIMASAAGGKGIASQALELVRPIHEENELLIPGDSTYPAFFKQLAEQGGVGYMHESEGSVITDIWRNGAMSYNTALRKAAEHEPLSRSRVSGREEIRNPRLSMLLTGTFDQFRTLVPNVQNGFFSRLSILVVRGQQGFDRTIFMPKSEGDTAGSASQRMLALYEQLYCRTTPVEFRLSAEQSEQLGEYFEREYTTLVQALGENFHPTIVRMGVTTMRIACILTTLRGVTGDTLLCSDEDYHTAVTIASKLLLHAADAYNQIEGAKTQAVPESKGSYQRQMLLASLPEEFTRDLYLQRARQNGIPVRTADRWLSDWSHNGTFLHLDYGEYKRAC